MKKEQNLQTTTEHQMGYDTLLCGVILKVLDKWDEPTDCFDAIWLGYNGLHDECEAKYSIKELKAGMKQLSQMGKVEMKPTYDEDGKINGRGWFLNAT